MNSNGVGFSIIDILTESLYDEPSVIFREYVQNAVDSFKSVQDDNEKLLECHIIVDRDNICFIDNGNGIREDEFDYKMHNISRSSKRKRYNIGYKGIGRLSGIPYCDELIFVNILSYSEKSYQIFSIDCKKFRSCKNSEEYSNMEFSDGLLAITKTVTSITMVEEYLKTYSDMFVSRDTGFLVYLKNYSDTICNVDERKDGNYDRLIENLSWKLPVGFKEELMNTEYKDVFFEFLKPLGDNSLIPAQSFNIFFNDKRLERPLDENMLRAYTSNIKFGDYGIGFVSFCNENDELRLSIEKNNSFSGIRIYLDNMLLCDEKELIMHLSNMGLLSHSTNETLQSVKGVGAAIFITNKENITCNARRTFIEILNAESIDFLKIISEFIDRIYDARYAMSNFVKESKKITRDNEKYGVTKRHVEECLQLLANDIIEIEEQEEIPFNERKPIEREKAIKDIIKYGFEKDLKNYFKETTDFDRKSAYDDFVKWIISKYGTNTSD